MKIDKIEKVRATILVMLFMGLSLSVRPSPKVFILGDMDKPTGNAEIQSSPGFFQNGTIVLHSAANEVIAFQALLQADRDEPGLDARVSDLTGPVTIKADQAAQLFLAYYIKAKDASYSWGSGSAGALPWRGLYWPDALIPLRDPYGKQAEPVAVPFAIHPTDHRNQALWVDLFVPKDTPAGEYRGTLKLLQNGNTYQSLPIRLEVFPFNLPDQTHVDAYGELYRETGVMFDSGARFKDHPLQDWPIYKRYIQMAHAHRFLATHRAGGGPIPRMAGGKPAETKYNYWSNDWSLYTPYVKPVLDGSLFTEKEGYNGPCVATPPSFFPSPFRESFYGAGELKSHMRKYQGSIDPWLLSVWRENAESFWREVKAQGWQNVRFFAYIMDEVDGSQDQGAGAGNGEAVAALVHQGMRQTQQALDQGTGGQRKISLMWTSHVDPQRWINTPADLRDFITWWVPNGRALNPAFFGPIERQPGQTVWFYHSGQPAIGNHTINQTGIDLRLWGLLCWRYQIQGSFWWSMMCFPKPLFDPTFNPYQSPTYKAADTRWGNGVLFYPGSRLTLIGCRRGVDGPIPSLRMKAYRRGLQDYEYCWLARQRGKGPEADQLIRQLIPFAFADAPIGSVPGLWSKNTEDYYQMRLTLARMIIPTKP